MGHVGTTPHEERGGLGSATGGRSVCAMPAWALASSAEKTTPCHGSISASLASKISAGESLAADALAGCGCRGRPHSSRSTGSAVAGRGVGVAGGCWGSAVDARATSSSGHVSRCGVTGKGLFPELAAAPVTSARRGGRQVRQPPPSWFQHSVQTYWRQSRQKWKVPAKRSADSGCDGVAAGTASEGSRGTRRPNSPSLLLGCSAEMASGSLKV